MTKCSTGVTPGRKDLYWLAIPGDIVHHDRGGMTARTGDSWLHCLCNRNQRAMNAGTLFAFSLLANPGPQPME